MLEVLRDGKAPILKFICGDCGAVFLASIDDLCYKKSFMGISYYERCCPKCNNWVSGKDTGLCDCDEDKEALEQLKADILREVEELEAAREREEEEESESEEDD